MNFLVDARLPTKLARALEAAGHDAVHTSDLSSGNRTTDAEITRRADAEDRVVVSKDADFRDGHLLARSPRRLLIVATGNISNTALVNLLDVHLETIVAAFADADFVELRAGTLVTHQRRHDATGRDNGPETPPV